MKKIVILFLILAVGCKSKKSAVDDRNLLAKIDSLQTKIESLEKEILLQKETIDFLEDDLQFKESEISYWGRKYDSLKWVGDK